LTGISYDSRIPVAEYLSLFGKVDRERIHTLLMGDN